MILSTALMCLTMNGYFEARSEPISGIIATMETVLNRVESQDYPNTVCEVVLQENKRGCQYSWWCDGLSDFPREENSLKTAKALAQLMLDEGDYISVVGSEATHYHTDDVLPYWAKSKEFRKIKQVGKHIFYRIVKSDEFIRPMQRPKSLEK